MSHKSLLVLVAASSITLGGIGCSSSGLSQTDPLPEARLAAYGASTHYPSVQPTMSNRIATLISRKTGAVRVINFGTQPLTDANVWINGAFVHRVDSVPPGGFVTLQRSDFYDNSGTALSNLSTGVNRVDVQTGEQLQTTMGPVLE